MRLTPASASSPANLRKLRAVGGQRQLVERAALQMARKLAHQMHDVLAHQRLAAGQPQLADALLDEDGAEPVELFERQQVLLRQEGHVLGHAIGAAEVAAVGDRYAQIGDRATERVDHVHCCIPFACIALGTGLGRVVIYSHVIRSGYRFKAFTCVFSRFPGLSPVREAA